MPTVTHRLIVAPAGGGKTHALKQISGLYCDLNQTPRTVLTQLLQYFSEDKIKVRENTATLTQKLCEQLANDPRPLLLDNLDCTTERIRKTIILKLCESVRAGIIATATDPTKLDAITLAYFAREDIPPIADDTARALIWTVLDRSKTTRPNDVEKTIVRQAHGNPAAVLAYARRVRENGIIELRHIQTRTPRINISFIALTVLLVGIYFARFHFEWSSDLALAAIVVSTMFVRFAFNRGLRDITRDDG